MNIAHKKTTGALATLLLATAMWWIPMGVHAGGSRVIAPNNKVTVVSRGGETGLATPIEGELLGPQIAQAAPAVTPWVLVVRVSNGDDPVAEFSVRDNDGTVKSLASEDECKAYREKMGHDDDFLDAIDGLSKVVETKFGDSGRIVVLCEPDPRV